MQIVEYPAAFEPVLLLHLILSRKLLSAFVAASLDNISAVLRAHSLTEAVHFGALSLFGLISLFHFIILSFYINIIML